MPLPARRSVQYTIRGIPADLDKELRRMAKARELSLNRFLIQELAEGIGKNASRKYRSMEGIAGKWADDQEFDRIIQEQRQIDEALWR